MVTLPKIHKTWLVNNFRMATYHCKSMHSFLFKKGFIKKALPGYPKHQLKIRNTKLMIEDCINQFSVLLKTIYHRINESRLCELQLPIRYLPSPKNTIIPYNYILRILLMTNVKNPFNSAQN